MISIRGLTDLRRRLASLDFPTACAEATKSAASALAARIRGGLAVAPGGPHDRPWLRSGDLHDSIAADSDATGVTVGSTEAVAVDQELGTQTVPPRPFLAPTAAKQAPELAETIGARLSTVLKAIWT